VNVPDILFESGGQGIAPFKLFDPAHSNPGNKIRVNISMMTNL
jgi:hypothetical protein